MSYTNNPDSGQNVQFNNTDAGALGTTDNGEPIHGITAEKHITIQKSPEEVYQFWHNFENLPLFMKHLESVSKTGPDTSHWVAKAPAGNRVEWDAEIVSDIPNELIAWHSVEPADVPNAGVVRFRPSMSGFGTDLDVQLEYRPPAGVVGAAVAKLFGEEPSQQIEDDLERFKEYIETGYVAAVGS